MDKAQLPLIVIVGPTASGKTTLAIKLAKQFRGEIICADSRTVYKGMDIGTAKPTVEERKMVPHWGLDLVNPVEQWTVSDFKKYANQKIVEIRRRGHVPFLVGGTGLYVDAIIFNFSFGAKADQSLRQVLEEMSLEELQDYCIKHNIIMPENSKNKRHLVRAIERNNPNTISQSGLIDNSFVVGIATTKNILRTRIEFRTEQLFDDNVVKEATELAEEYGWDSEAMTGNVYPLVRQFLNNELSKTELVQKSTSSDRSLAKRQMTWFRRNPYILWAELSSAEQSLSNYLASLNNP
ncbi:tRNA (adenosine(37)-N6)-dimethylallyltransferase MiaA [Candidatus Saccharibacteria bacterium]|nr:tRNA (adenosine(37)-N6)-dimethylallyltransferase MiaA [Candidatus Saccharibacteria bacterium]